MSRTFGVEIETFAVPPNEIVLALSRVGIVAQIESYNHDTRRHWKLVSDGSIRGEGVTHPIEVVSPILQGDEGMRQVELVLNTLKSIGCKVNKTCGLHVHVGASDIEIKQFRNIAKNYLIWEDFFDAIMPKSRRLNNNNYVLSNRFLASGSMSHDAARLACDKLDECETIDAVIRVANRHGERHAKLNMTAWHRQKTIEFRQHAGTLDAAKTLHWIAMCLRFIEHAATSKPMPRAIGAQPTQSEIAAQFYRAYKVTPEARSYFNERRKTLANADA